MSCAKTEREETRAKEDDEMENQLRALEERIRRAEEISHECRDEVREMLEAFARSLEAAERRGQKPKSAAPE
jgi:cell division FtsZ-interacting protein ZapD